MTVIDIENALRLHFIVFVGGGGGIHNTQD